MNGERRIYIYLQHDELLSNSITDRTSRISNVPYIENIQIESDQNCHNQVTEDNSKETINGPILRCKVDPDQLRYSCMRADPSTEHDKVRFKELTHWRGERVINTAIYSRVFR